MKSHAKYYRGHSLSGLGILSLSCSEVSEIYPDIFPVKDGHEYPHSANSFAECSGHVELMPSGALLYVPHATKEGRFDNVGCFIWGRKTRGSRRMWDRIPEKQ
jgi:hypothetical protein